MLIPGELSAQLGGKYGNQAKGAELGKEMPLSSNLGGFLELGQKLFVYWGLC